MASKQCEQCSEMVDEAKAFCPGCGHAFVSERSRGELSDYEAKGQTMQLGQTMYNQMLADMGLNLSKASIPVEHAIPVETKVETIAPVETSAPRTPAWPTTPAPAVQGMPPVEPVKKGINKWIIVAVAALLLIFFAALLVIVAAFGFYYFSSN